MDGSVGSFTNQFLAIAAVKRGRKSVYVSLYSFTGSYISFLLGALNSTDKLYILRDERATP